MTSEERRTELRRRFRRFARTEAVPQSSSLYERLCDVVAGDDMLIDIATEVGPGQPVPNLLFGAVHALLETDRDADLAQYYLSLGGTRALDDEVGEAFRSFVIHHEDEIAELLRTRLVQTNEVRRSAVLLPALVTVSTQHGGAPLALIEIGASAGLNLLFDRYAYRYSGRAAGDPTSPLVLDSEVRGGQPPLAPIPRVASRLGLELNALDVQSEEDMRWLRALVWPEHEERRRILAAAVGIARKDPPEVRTADVFEALPSAIADAPADAAVVLVATFVLNQFSLEMRARLKALLVEASREREVTGLAVGYPEWFGDERLADGSASVHLARFRDGEASVRRLAVCDPHGWWIDWNPQPWIDWAD